MTKIFLFYNKIIKRLSLFIGSKYRLFFYTLEDLKCRFYSTKNIQGLPVAERVNYGFVRATTLTDEF